MTDTKTCAYEPCGNVFHRTNQTGFQWQVKRFCCQRCQIAYNEHKEEIGKFKTCLRCGIEKHIYQFHKNRDKSDGHTSYCKSCKQEIYKESQMKPNRYGNSDLARDMAKLKHLQPLLCKPFHG